MSGMVYERGSVVTFTPHTGPGVSVYVRNVGDAPVIGWATVVVKRSQWVVTTVLRPVVVINGDMTILEVDSLSVSFDVTETKST